MTNKRCRSSAPDREEEIGAGEMGPREQGIFMLMNDTVLTVGQNLAIGMLSAPGNDDGSRDYNRATRPSSRTFGKGDLAGLGRHSTLASCQLADMGGGNDRLRFRPSQMVTVDGAGSDRGGSGALAWHLANSLALVSGARPVEAGSQLPAHNGAEH